MRVILTLLFASLLPAAAFGKDILVSLGSSPSSTRLVLTFEELPTWTSVVGEGTLELSFESGSYQLNPVDSRNAATSPRVSRFSDDGTGQRFVLEFSCDCQADVYPFGSGSLVVEVRDALEPGPMNGDQASDPIQPPTPPIAASSFGDMAPPNRPVPAQNPGRLVEIKRKEAPPHPRSTFPWPMIDVEAELADTLGFSLRTNTESQAVELLSRELSRAAAQGLVASGSGEERLRRDETPTLGESTLEDRSNIKIITSLDRAMSADLGRHPPTHNGSICFPDSEVDLAAWGDTTDISTIGKLRHAAYGENGEITPDGAKDLARFYIALGFGAEAAVAARFMESGSQRDLLLALAEIVDHRASAAPILDGQIYCRGQVALWAALARPIRRNEVPDSIDVILSTFSALSPHLRAHFGPVLAERLREVGLEVEARNAVNAVARGGLQSNESELVTARLELGGTRPDIARETLVEISNGTDLTAAKALLELLKDAERRNMAPNPAWVEDAPSLARATEGTEVAEALNLAGLRGRIALGQFDELRHALAEDTPGLNAQTRNALSGSAIVQAARRADDAVFLRSEVGLLKLLNVDDMTNAERFEVARRLVSIGLPARAQTYLRDDPGSTDDLRTFVGVLAATGQGDAAIAFLSARVDREATRQLGHVLSRNGKNDQAVRAFEESGSLDEAAQSAIRAGDWAWIAAQNIPGSTGALSDAARTLTTHNDTQDEIANGTDEPMNGRLITASQNLRRHAQNLLSETDLSSIDSAFTN